MKQVFKDLFSTPILKIEDFVEEDVNNFMKRYLINKHKKEAPKTNSTSWHTDFTKYEFAPKCFKELYSKVEVAFQDYLDYWTRRDKSDEDFSEDTINDPLKNFKDINIWSWVVYQSKGAYIIPHAHPTSSFSFVYYCKVPKDKGTSGYLELIHPILGAFNGMPHKFQENILVEPKERMLIGIPSYLVHWVHPNNSEDLRISVPFDISITREPNLMRRF